VRLTSRIYPQLLKLAEEGALTEGEIESVVAASAEAYPFPANLDNDAPLGPSGLTPASQQETLRQALAEKWSAERFNEEIEGQETRRIGA
ncbi:MAG: hypothetical protein NXH88_12525, partial [Hyphomonas sp.]|nr:hypothetical protein [Hyphomonas sp.]